jgi:DNA-binding Lrp family transcriptional regulator
MLSHKLDRIDVNILAQLQRNGRMSKVDLAEAVALSPSPCLTRVSRLERCGYILGYNANVNVELLGQTSIVFSEVTLTHHHTQVFNNFENKIRTVDEVLECHRISSEYDYLLKFVTRDIAHYQSLMEEILEGDFGIAKFSTYIVLKSPVTRSYYPINKIFDIDGASDQDEPALDSELEKLKIGENETHSDS